MRVGKRADWLATPCVAMTGGAFGLDGVSPQASAGVPEGGRDEDADLSRNRKDSQAASRAPVFHERGTRHSPAGLQPGVRHREDTTGSRRRARLPLTIKVGARAVLTHEDGEHRDRRFGATIAPNAQSRPAPSRGFNSP